MNKIAFNMIHKTMRLPHRIRLSTRIMNPNKMRVPQTLMSSVMSASRTSTLHLSILAITMAHITAEEEDWRSCWLTNVAGLGIVYFKG